MHESRGAELTPADLAAWEARAYPQLGRQRDAAKATPVDDALPEDPQHHLAETRAALARIPAR